MVLLDTSRAAGFWLPQCPYDITKSLEVHLYILGIPKETHPGEGRVSLLPSAVRRLIQAGHAVLVEQDAGLASGLGDEDFLRAGAEIVPTAEELFSRSSWIASVMRPDAHMVQMLRPGQGLSCLLHAGPALPSGVRVEALERWEQFGERPVLAAMSELAGRLGVQAASLAMQQQAGGRGLFLGGVPGVPPAEVLVIGAGVAGRAAAHLSAAMGARVTVLDVNLHALRALSLPGVHTLIATPHSTERLLAQADVVIVAIRGEQNRIAGRGHLALMRPGAVIVDLSIVDGGAFASTPVTTLEMPSQIVDGIVHIGVPNFCGAIPRTSSVALSHAALPRLLEVLSVA